MGFLVVRKMIKYLRSFIKQRYKITIHNTNNLGDIYYYEIYFRGGITKGKTTYVVRRNGAK